jgi:hypothetical protein
MRMLQEVIASWCEEHKAGLHDERAKIAKREIFDLYQLGVKGHPAGNDQIDLGTPVFPRVLPLALNNFLRKRLLAV